VSRNGADASFAWQDRAALAEITAVLEGADRVNALAVYVVLTWRPNAGLWEWSQILGLDEATIQRAIDGLVEAGVLERAS